MKKQMKKQDDAFSPWAGSKVSDATKKFLASCKPLAPAKMAAGMVKTHGADRARRIVEPLTVKSFMDKGVATATNESSGYWSQVLRALK